MRKGVLQLIGGNGVAQGLQLCALILLSRLYAPSSFGLAGEIQSWASIFAVLITLQLHLALVLSEDELQLSLARKKTLAISLLIFFVLLPFLCFLELNYFFAVALALFVGVNNTNAAVLVYRGDFFRLSIFYIVRAVFVVAAQLVFAFLDGEFGLIYGMVMGEVMASAYLFFLSTSFKSLKTIFKGLGALNLWLYIVERRSFSLYGTLQELVSVLAFFAPLLLFVRYYGADVGGQYAMSNRLVWAPVVLVSSSLANVFYHQFSKEQNFKIVRSVIWFNFKYAVLSILLVFLIAQVPIVTFVLGDQWLLAQELMPYMLVAGAIFIYSIPYRVAYRALEKQKYLLGIECVTLSIVFYIFFFELNPLTTIKILLLAHLVQVLLVWFVLRVLMRDMNYPVVSKRNA